MKKFLFILLQCTWGLPQTLLGLFFYLKHRRQPHGRYRGAIYTRWNSRGGMSLGLFIFTPVEQTPYAQKVRVHEFGHCVQSLLLGPGYLIIGLISVLWANLPCCRKLRREKKVPYTACFTESWASRWGELATGEEATWH